MALSRTKKVTTPLKKKKLTAEQRHKKAERQKKLQVKVEESLNVFQSEYKKLKKMVGSEAKDFQSDKSALAMLRSLLSMTIDLIPIAEDKFRTKGDEFSSRAVINLTTQARELAADIRNLKNVEEQASYINQEIIHLALKEITQNLINEMFILKKTALAEVKLASKKKSLQRLFDTSLRAQGDVISKIAFEARTSLEKYLLS